MKNQVYNAVHDFTEKDRAYSNYRRLWENKLRTEAHQFDLERQRAFNICLRTAIKDLSVWLALIAMVALVFVLIAK